MVDLDQPKPDEVTPPHWAALSGVADGSDVLAVLAERAGQPFPVTPTASAPAAVGRTCTSPDRLPSGSATPRQRGGLGWLIDTRGAGGYVVAAGSTVDRRPYTVLADREPAPLPVWLVRPAHPGG